MAFVTSIANDMEYAAIFYEQLYGMVREGDVVIGISASGNSENVLRAIQLAKEAGATTIGFAGFGGGELGRLADKSIILSCHDYGVIEDVHMSLGHIITYLVRGNMKQLEPLVAESPSLVSPLGAV
jgi:D-sedoheptulose 7-phosphate isomerase